MTALFTLHFGFDDCNLLAVVLDVVAVLLNLSRQVLPQPLTRQLGPGVGGLLVIARHHKADLAVQDRYLMA